MSRGETIELWPDNWKDTRGKAAGILTELKAKVSEGPLQTEELASANSVAHHLRGPWERSWRNPVVQEVVAVIRAHFAQAFALEQGPRRQMLDRILEATLPTGYFEDRDGREPELTAMAILLTYHWDTSRTSYRDRYKVDFSGLVNPNWHP